MKTYVVVYGDVDSSKDWVMADAEDLEEIERRFAEPVYGYSIYENRPEEHNLIKRVAPTKYSNAEKT